MPENAAHGNQPPRKDEALQYITYSAKELLYMLNEKVDGVDNKLDSMQVEFAKLPSVYVTQQQFQESQREALIAKRFAVMASLASIGALGTFIGFLVA